MKFYYAEDQYHMLLDDVEYTVVSEGENSWDIPLAQLPLRIRKMFSLQVQSKLLRINATQHILRKAHADLYE